MKKKKINSLSDEVFLPLDVYESLLSEVEKYRKIQEKGISWAKVSVNASKQKASIKKKLKR